MAEGNRRITLYRPGPVTGTSPQGDTERDEPTEFVVFATRRDRGGRAGEEQDIEIAQWTTNFRFRWSWQLSKMTAAWYVIDDVGRQWAIRWVQEFERRWITIYCEAYI